MSIAIKPLRDFLSMIYKTIFNDPKRFELRDWMHHYPDLFEIGDWTYGQPKIYFWDKKTKLKIGKFCSIAPDVVFLLGGNHRNDWITTYPFPILAHKWENTRTIQGHPATKGDIIIGNDVWIGHGSVILSGVRIGDGVSVGAGSVVAQSEIIAPNGMVPPYSIIAGNPVRIIGYRFSQTVIDELLAIQWWNWPIEKIKMNVEILCSNNVDKLREIAKSK